jgi:hypothetical protein
MTLIAQGKASLIRAPAAHGNDPGLTWVSLQLKLLSLKPPELLEECLGAFAAQYSNTTFTELSRAVEAEILNDMLRMQTQPQIMENYRRFVIVVPTTPRPSQIGIGQEAVGVFPVHLLIWF